MSHSKICSNGLLFEKTALITGASQGIGAATARLFAQHDPVTLSPLQTGEEGLIQLLSILPSSYPGHSLLTEDLGVLKGQDDCACGRKGRYFIVTGRLSQAETRGCSDTLSN